MRSVNPGVSAETTLKFLRFIRVFKAYKVLVFTF